jgi:hypothetical protein
LNRHEQDTLSTHSPNHAIEEVCRYKIDRINISYYSLPATEM